MKIFLNDKERNILLHSVNVYLEKLDFVLNNIEYYDVGELTEELLKKDYSDLINLRTKLFCIDIKNLEGS